MMTKQEFTAGLRRRLSGVPEAELEERLAFYEEMIDDRIEEGISEEEAVLGIGSVEEIAAQILADVPLTRIAREAIRGGRRLRAWEIVLLVLGSPVWLPLALAALVVMLALFVVLWSLVGSVWAVFAALTVSGPVAVAGGLIVAIGGSVPAGLVVVAAGIACVGLAIFTFFGCLAATKGAAWLTKGGALALKRCFIRKEKV